jgi:hypothetical protein
MDDPCGMNEVFRDRAGPGLAGAYRLDARGDASLLGGHAGRLQGDPARGGHGRELSGHLESPRSARMRSGWIIAMRSCRSGRARAKRRVAKKILFPAKREKPFHLYENKYLTRFVISINPPLRART